MMDLVGSPIAIVGPNEAGKTTFLRSLVRLNDDEDFDQSALTRRGDGTGGIEAIFDLEREEFDAIKHIRGVGTPRQLSITKREDDRLHWSLDPAIKPDLEPRRKAAAALAKLLAGKWAKDHLDDEPRQQLAGVAELLDRDDLLDESEIETLRDGIEPLRTEDVPASASSLAKALDEIAEVEAAGDPCAAAAQILLRRRPRFLMFEDAWRQLESEFNVNGTPGPATTALLELAGVDLTELRNAISAGDQPRVTEIVEEGNAGFATLFTDRWRQAKIRIHLDVNADLVHVFIKNASGRLIPIAERSDGLKQFVALLAFVEQEAPGADIVLLVDEAESHLHYDAQADLVQMFTNQQVVQKILYTTHSAGCLPGDLGAGIRVIEPIGDPATPPEDWEHSRISNAFWADRKGRGYSPLLMAMGASTFAFSATRRAVIGEGISEVILLPSLFREATGKESLTFQIAPGISTVSPERVTELDDAAARVVYLVDADEGGLKNREKLLEAGVVSEDIFVLGIDDVGVLDAPDAAANPPEPLAVEDLVDFEVYIAAVNEEIARDGHAIAPEDIPGVARKRAVAAWCDERGIDVPSERIVSQRILDIGRDRVRRGQPAGLLDAGQRDLARDLHSKIAAALR